LPPSPAGPPPLATRDGAAMPLGGDRLQNDTPPMLLGPPRSIPHGPRGGGAGGGDRGAGLAAAPLESQQHRLRRRAQAGAGVGLERPPTSLGVGPLRGVPH
ncbi:hypothetical protein EMIHUDRAFT_358679, partial [Emiliania huxleyi CCMP1516]|uniref:Uncharacterized protein n=2 Tax=Emiliania huxleyi TaxID=2903 RepID=A0A0D3ICX2_EMIH1